MKQSIPSSLLALVKEDDKERFLQDYREANFVLDVIKEAIDDKYEGLLRQEESPELLSTSESYVKYTYIMGQRHMAKMILNLFPTKQR